MNTLLSFYRFATAAFGGCPTVSIFPHGGFFYGCFVLPNVMRR
ncbi:hypothetical protein [Neisseria sp. CCUG12390]